MNLWRWFGTLAILAGFFIVYSGSKLPVSAGEKDKDKDKAAQKDKVKNGDKDKGKDDADKDKGKKVDPPVAGDRLAWKAFDDPKKSFYQRIETITEQKMTVMGQQITQKQNQTFFILWTPKEKTKEGNWVVSQKIVGVVMKIDIGGNVIQVDSRADKQPNNPMNDFFAALLKLELTLTIDPATMSVKSIDGRQKFVEDLGATNPQMKGLLNSILSEEALKQMAEPTWGAFPPGGDFAKPWSRTSKLDLGPIGTYETKFDYNHQGLDAKDKADKIGIKAELTYKAPDGKGGLPFTIESASLKSKDGAGSASFDRQRGRFSRSDMKMNLEGNLKITVGGMPTDVVLSQTQEARVETSDEEPADLKLKK